MIKNSSTRTISQYCEPTRTEESLAHEILESEPVSRLNVEPDLITFGDALKVLQAFPSSCVDFIITSPPYANNRHPPYQGIPMDGYVEWFKPISEQLKRVLQPTGSFILVIKERVHDGERATYVLELIIEMRKQGWLWTEEYIWHKKFKMFQEAVMVPMGNWAQKRLERLSETDLIRDESRSLSGFGKNVSNWLGKKHVYPTNVLHLATECSNRNHSAAFPISLPVWFINLFTEQGDVVLDPFIGSGTTALACIQLGRHFIGIEKVESYYQQALATIVSEAGQAVGFRYDLQQRELFGGPIALPT
jgi:site-specific DNA-methyltransferase (adenine-specific)